MREKTTQKENIQYKEKKSGLWSQKSKEAGALSFTFLLTMPLDMR